MRSPGRAEEEAARAAATVTRRAIRRLDVFEWVIFGGALVVAILGGGLIASLIAGPTGLDFRVTWIVTALSLFVVGGVIAIIQMRRDERTSTPPRGDHREGDDG